MKITLATLGCGAVIVAAASCAHKSSSPASDALAARVPVGADVHWQEFNSIGEAPSCSTTFDGAASSGVRATPGRFTGMCKDHQLTFEAVPVATVKISLEATNVGLEPGELAYAVAPFKLDHQHPDWTITIKANPFDDKGGALDGRFGPGAHWQLGEDCATSVRANGVSDLNKPVAEIGFTAVAAGTCTINVEYGAAKTSTSITVL